MQNYAIFLVLIVTIIIVPQAFAENLFFGKTTFERVPEVITPEIPAEFEIKFQYHQGPYALQDLTPVIEISPKAASSKVHLDVKPINLNPSTIGRIPVTITVDKTINHEKIFLIVTYAGIGLNDTPFQSAWADSLVLNISQKNPKRIPDNCEPVDLETEISDGTVLVTCHNTNDRSVMVIVNSQSSNTLQVAIPKKMVYSLMHSNCIPTNDFFVISNGEEIQADIIAKDNVNVVSVKVQKGINEIEIVGAVIIPDPSPDQYCGIVEGYDKQYLAPLDQIQHGVGSKHIRCNEGLFLIQKINNSPACVKPDSIAKLTKRGWAIPQEIPNILDEVALQKKFKETLEVQKFYDTYENVDSYFRDNRLNYVSENDDFRIRLSLHLDENYNLSYMDFFCFAGDTLKHEIAQEDILKYLDNPLCKTSEIKSSDLQVRVSGEQQVRRGVTHTIEVNVSRDNVPVENAWVKITIEDYGEDIIREFDGYTNQNGYFEFSWEIPKSFDDIETLLAFVDVTDDISAKTVLFKFQVYCLPGEVGCKAEGN